LLSSSFNCPPGFHCRCTCACRDIVLTRRSRPPVIAGDERLSARSAGNAETTPRHSALPSVRLSSRFLPCPCSRRDGSLASVWMSSAVSLARSITPPLRPRPPWDPHGRGCRFLGAWPARARSALFSDITSTKGNEGRGTRRETPSDHARLNFRVGGNAG